MVGEVAVERGISVDIQLDAQCAVFDQSGRRMAGGTAGSTLEVRTITFMDSWVGSICYLREGRFVFTTLSRFTIGTDRALSLFVERTVVMNLELPQYLQHTENRIAARTLKSTAL